MIFLFLTLNLWAQDILIQSENVSDISFEQYLHKNPHKETYSKNYLQQESKLSDSLLSYLKKAQYEFINGSLDSAKSSFKKMISIQHEENWDLNQRKSINYAFFRLAQLSKQEQKVAYVKKAISFDSAIAPDAKLFPPPFTALFYKIKNTLEPKVWPLPDNASSFKSILINGKLHSPGQSFIKTSVGEKRFTFVSNKFKSVTITAKASALSKHKLSLSPLAAGECESPQILPTLNKKNHYALYDKECVIPTNIQSIVHIPVTHSFESNQNTKKVWKNDSTWVWIGLTALTTLVAWKALENQNKQDPQPIPAAKPTQRYISNSQGGT